MTATNKQTNLKLSTSPKQIKNGWKNNHQNCKTINTGIGGECIYLLVMSQTVTGKWKRLESLDFACVCVRAGECDHNTQLKTFEDSWSNNMHLLNQKNQQVLLSVLTTVIPWRYKYNDSHYSPEPLNLISYWSDFCFCSSILKIKFGLNFFSKPPLYTFQ